MLEHHGNKCGVSLSPYELRSSEVRNERRDITSSLRVLRNHSCSLAISVEGRRKRSQHYDRLRTQSTHVQRELRGTTNFSHRYFLRTPLRFP